MYFALREIRRTRTRFVLLASALTLLVLLVVGLQAMLGGLLTQFVGAIEHQSGDVLVFGRDARSNVEGSMVSEEQRDAVGAVAGVDAAEPIVEGALTVRPGADGGDGTGRPREPVDAVVFGYALGEAGEPTTLAEGRMPERAGEAVASAADREEGFDLGERVSLGDGAPTVEVVGLADEVNYLTRPTMFVDVDTAVAAKQAANPDAAEVPASVIAVEVSSGEDPEAVAERITAQVEGVEALSREEAADATPGAAATSQSIWLIIMVALAAAAVVVGFFFAILAVQQSSTNALLRAVGASRGVLTKTLAAELAASVAAAVAVGTALVALVDATVAGGELVDLDPSALLFTLPLLVAGAALASLGAFRRARHVDPLAVVWGGAR